MEWSEGLDRTVVVAVHSVPPLHGWYGVMWWHIYGSYEDEAST